MKRIEGLSLFTYYVDTLSCEVVLSQYKYFSFFRARHVDTTDVWRHGAP